MWLSEYFHSHIGCLGLVTNPEEPQKIFCELVKIKIAVCIAGHSVKIMNVPKNSENLYWLLECNPINILNNQSSNCFSEYSE